MCTKPEKKGKATVKFKKMGSFDTTHSIQILPIILRKNLKPLKKKKYQGIHILGKWDSSSMYVDIIQAYYKMLVLLEFFA